MSGETNKIALTHTGFLNVLKDINTATTIEKLLQSITSILPINYIHFAYKDGQLSSLCVCQCF